ncbi:MAG: cyclodeaminase/cyclohydrolase family protein [Candidatus Omnitrophota bacterium]
MYIDKTLREYLNDLAAKKPAPGGGSAAALSASIGAGLMSMVANYTVGNPKYRDSDEKIAPLLAKIEKLRDELEDLIDKDVEAYNKLSKGMKVRGKNPAGHDELYKESVKAPFEICKLSFECLKMCPDLARYGNPNLITDTAIAAILLEGAFFSAKFNAFINLKNVKDMKFIEMVAGTLSPLENEAPKLKEDILEMCEDVISK